MLPVEIALEDGDRGGVHGSYSLFPELGELVRPDEGVDLVGHPPVDGGAERHGEDGALLG